MGALGLAGTAAWVWFGPLPADLARAAPSKDYVFVDRGGRALDALRTPTASGRGGPPLSATAPRLALATLMAEDQRFRGHGGVDPQALLRATIVNVGSRRVVQGGSTITQQLVKLRGHRGKLAEMVYAVRLERRLTKDQILSAYLAEAPYGGRVVGATAASQYYFAKPPSQISWAEAAFLAALPQRPTAFNPTRDARAALSRQRWILGRLHSARVITAAELRAARAEVVRINARTTNPSIAPHLTEMLATRLRQSGSPGGRVVTTLDDGLQRDVVGVITQYRRLLRRYGAHNAAVVVLDNRSGEVRAWEGSGAYFDVAHAGMLNGPLLPRQPGSAVKPFIYATAFAKGAKPQDLIDDDPVTFEWNGEAFTPQNYDKRFRGAVSLRTALASSINVPAVKLLRQVGLPAIGATLSGAGLHTPQPVPSYGLALALGSSELDLLSMTRAYAAFARGGSLPPVRIAEGEAGLLAAATESPAFTPEVARQISDVLSDNEARAPAFGRRSALLFPFPVAAKTGTSQGFHDNWVIGYTPEVTVGVWVGNFDRTPLAQGANGVTGAGPIFRAVMFAAHDRLVGSGVATSFVAEVERSPTPNSATRAAPASRRLTLLEPAAGARFVLDPAVPAAFQQLPLQASGGTAPYVFIVDGRRVSGDLWPLRAGAHESCVVDATNRRRCHAFTVD